MPLEVKIRFEETEETVEGRRITGNRDWERIEAEKLKVLAADDHNADCFLVEGEPEKPIPDGRWEIVDDEELR